MTMSVAQRSFNGGEWSPSLYSRVDLSKYPSAVKIMQNFYPHPHGGVSNRGGTKLIAEVKDSSVYTRLYRFQFSVVEYYFLELGDQYIRFYRDEGRITEADVTISGATQASPVVITATSHGFSNGDWVVISEVVGMTEINGKTFIVANASTHTFELTDVDGNNVNGTGYTAYSTGGVVNRVYEITSPYVTADLPLLKFEQSADVLTITHPSYAVRELTRTGHTSWTLSTVAFGSSVSAPGSFTRSAGSGTGSAYVVTAISTDTGEESVAATPVTNNGPGDTWTWASVSGAGYYNIYKDDRGAQVYGYIGQANTTTFTEPSAGITPDYTVTPPEANTPFNSTDTYPAVAAYHEQRLNYARTSNNPQTVFGSVVGGFNNMNKSKPLQQDDSYEYTLNARQVNEIKWMVSLDVLIIGTSGGEWRMAPGGNNTSISPLSVDVTPQSRWGSSDVPPLVIGDTVLFIERRGDRVRDLRYSLEVDRYASGDLTLLARHLFDGFSISEWAYQQSPDSIIWAVRNDGVLLGFTYYREHEIWAWHRHVTQGSFESIASISSEAEDEVWCIVKRTINGTVRRYIEKLKPRLPKDEGGAVDQQDAYFVDCGLTLDSPVTITGATKANPVVITAANHGFSDGDLVDIVDVVGMSELNGNRYLVANKTTNTFEIQTESAVDVDGTGYTAYASGGQVRKAVTIISNLDHLEGEDVAVLANGLVQTGKTVTNGSITLSPAASRVHVGLGYTSILETLDLEYQTETGTVQDKLRNILSVVVEMADTMAFAIGPNSDWLSEVEYTSLNNGDREIPIDASNEREAKVYVQNTYPVPVTITSIIARMDHGEN